jgi:hypothetical protein
MLYKNKNNVAKPKNQNGGFMWNIKKVSSPFWFFGPTTIFLIETKMCIKKHLDFFLNNVKLFRHFEFTRKTFSIKILFIPKVNKRSEKLTNNHIWIYWVKNRKEIDAILHRVTILNFDDWQQLFFQIDSRPN